MKNKRIRNTIALVALLMLPLLLQTVHVLHVSKQAGNIAHCHHTNEESHHGAHEHEKCLICDFEFGLFSDEIVFFDTAPLQFHFKQIVADRVCQPLVNNLLVQRLRGPPYSTFLNI